MELQRRQEFDKMQTERQELLSVLTSIQRDQQSGALCSQCSARTSPASSSTTSSSMGAVGGKVTTL